ncbi:hypothetical protein [uncultured Acinetobacter sp.]|uniref:hypothetical protein n=1 Tax=uncultured Acinetobacter sp. TaxID=165433 RepID=UPI00258A7BF0|nr:hypothetical protein [uncultured Acinetobacter sp.]
MTNYIIDNIRLSELMIITQQNKNFFDEFVQFLNFQGYTSIYQFIQETSKIKVQNILRVYFSHQFSSFLYDGIGNAYKADKAKWLFICWLLRDAPEQRLRPIVSSLNQGNKTENQIYLISQLIEYIKPIFPSPISWTWEAFMEVMLDRLEGSRRALKGGFIEGIVRSILFSIFSEEKLNSLSISPKQIALGGETYDVSISGPKGTILMPVKSRETMGGGHAQLFTRDIHKSISVAEEYGFMCIPVIFAESWQGNLKSLPCQNYIYLPINPNQIASHMKNLESEVKKIITTFASIG